jgi:hypothetical protein
MNSRWSDGGSVYRVEARPAGVAYDGNGQRVVDPLAVEPRSHEAVTTEG